MDFLLLFSDRQRVVIEIDGQQHYSENGIPSPIRYAEMVAEDRRLKLTGYEIYRFGGSELMGEGVPKIVLSFFSDLLHKYG